MKQYGGIILNLKNNVTVFKIFYFVAVSIFITFIFISKQYPFFTKQRAVYETVAYAQFVLLGTITLLKPHLLNEAFMRRKREIKSRDYWNERMFGIVWILLGVSLIISTLRYIM